MYIATLHSVARHAYVQVCKEDFEEALKEVKPAFGAVTELLEAYRLNGIIDYGEHFRHLLSVCKQLVEQERPFSPLSRYPMTLPGYIFACIVRPGIDDIYHTTPLQGWFVCF